MMDQMRPILEAGLEKLGLDTGAVPALTEYARLLLETNQVMNLTAITDPKDVATLPVLAELCLPLVKEGGWFLAMKSVDSDAETAAAAHALEILGGRLEKAEDYVIPGTDVRHRLLFIKKVKETPKKYPRAFAKIKKDPL